jgi:hypothetical protein
MELGGGGTAEHRYRGYERDRAKPETNFERDREKESKQKDQTKIT